MVTPAVTLPGLTSKMPRRAVGGGTDLNLSGTLHRLCGFKLLDLHRFDLPQDGDDK